MSPYRVILAEIRTGKVRRPDAPTQYSHGGPGESWRTVDTEERALEFKDEILGRFPELEVTVLAEDGSGAVRVFRFHDGAIVCEVTERKKAEAYRRIGAISCWR